MKTEKVTLISAYTQFQQAKLALEEAEANLKKLVGESSFEVLDAVSQQIMDIANGVATERTPTARRISLPTARTRKIPSRNGSSARARTLQLVKRGEKLPFRDEVIKAVQGKKQFGTAEIIAGLEKNKAVPESKNLRGYITTTLQSNPDYFRQVSRGVYALKRRRLAPLKKKVKGELASADA